jgi:hypothetical protein
MAKKKEFDGIIVKSEVSPEGYLYCYDKNGRLCWGSPEPQRVVLMHDLRKYAKGLHIGSLGWTVPGTTDGYKWIDVEFDCGPRLSVLVYAIERVLPERADEVSARLIRDHRNTRFDADPAVAEEACRKWIRENYEDFLDIDHMVESGEGDEELYAFTFPSLQELASLKNEPLYPVKIGWTGDKDDGALGRIRGCASEKAAFPERPRILLVHATWNGRALETAIHKRLREQGRRVLTAPGVEWFLTNAAEIVALCNTCKDIVPRPPKKPLRGASNTLQEAFEAFGDSARVEEVQYPGTAAVGIRVARGPDKANNERREGSA